MAKVLLSLSLVDSRKRRKTKLVEMEEQALHADQVAIATAFVGALEDVTDLGVVRADIIYQGVTSGFDPVADSNVDTGATFVGVLHDKNGAQAAWKLPGVKMSLVGGDGTIGLTQTVIEDLLAFFIEDTPADLFISDGETMESWSKGKLDK